MNLTFALAMSGAVFGCALALAVPWRQRRSLIHWVFAAGMLVLAAESACAGLSASAGLPATIIEWQTRRLIVMSFVPGVWLLFALGYSRGNAREFLARWRWLVAAAFALPVGLAVACLPDLILSVGRTVGETRGILRLGWPGIAVHLLFLVGAVLVLMNLELTFRASVGMMRWRIKFMVLGLGVLFATRAYTSTQTLLFRGVDPSLESVNAGALVVACLLVLRALLRPGHFHADVYPAHSVLRNSITILLAGIYLLIVGVLAKVVTFLGGDAAFTFKAFFVLLALVALTVLLLSDRVRLHTRRFVSRHLQRPLYDYRTVWRRFTEATASRVEQTELCRAVVKLLADMFQVLSVTLWLVDHNKEELRFAASSSLSETKGEGLRPRGADAAAIIRALQSQADPIVLDASPAPWAAILRRCHPDEFHKGGGRICVPMLGGGQLLGLIMLGDRVSGVSFAPQDLDLLKCIGGQVGASLLGIRLSQKLLQAKELEAFQTMSAFFVHDLKNTASTLSLMLQNLPRHFDDPAFREDALRGIAKTVAHINHLIERLGTLRRDLTIQPVAADLNELVTKALADWAAAPGVDLVKELRPLPPVFVDREQMLKVVANLVLNATEALPGQGQVRIETSQRDGWTVLAVADNGCGMSAEFVSHALFRPFQTTKKRGLGIGMFQSKMIVEAHGGRLEVESELGKGTTFRVYLPAKAPTR